jgi:hypothetical protein
VPDTQPPKNGGIPHSYRLALAWRWIPGMPRELRRRKGFLTALHTLSTMADSNGRTRFADTGQPIRLSQLAAAMGSDEKEARRYLAAAIAAGVLTTEAEPRRGRTTVYKLTLAPSPRWAAAAAVLDVGSRDQTPQRRPEGTEHARADQPAQAPLEGEFGGRVPELSPASSGDGPPFSPQPVRGTGPRCSSGDGSPLSSGDGSPNNPGVPRNLPQEMVEVVPQPQDAHGRAHDSTAAALDDHPPPDTRPPLRPVPDPPPSGRSPRPGRQVPDGQAPLLLPVPDVPDDDSVHERAVTAADVHRLGWRQAVALLHPDPTGT